MDFFATPLGRIASLVIMAAIMYVVFGMSKNAMKEGPLNKHTRQEALDKGREFDHTVFKQHTDQTQCPKCGAGSEDIKFVSYGGSFGAKCKKCGNEWVFSENIR